MTVTLVGTGGYWTRSGAKIFMGDAVATHQADLISKVDNILDEFNDDREMGIVFENNLESYRSGAGGPLNDIASCISNMTIEMIHTDDALPAKTIIRAIERLRDQMIASADSIDGTTVSAATVAGSNTGDGEIITSMVDALGNALQYARAEDIVIKCTTDAQTSGTAGRESFSLEGELAVSNLDPSWPAGSGLSATLSMTDPSVDTGSGPMKNIGTNTDWENFTGEAPNNWTINTGDAGTTLGKNTTTPHRGTNTLRIIGTGTAELTDLSQAVTIKPNKKYAIAFWLRDDGTPPGAGVLRVALKDTAGNVFNASTSLTDANVDVTLSTIDSTWTLHSITFETPTLLPTGAHLSIELTTALTSGREIWIDGVIMAEMLQLSGLGSPYMLITPGETDHIRDDIFTTTITNNDEGQFVRGMDRYLDLYSKGLYFPSDTTGSETIPDSLVA